MTVTSKVELPAQPDSGTVQYVPLGGDGVSAPHGQYVVNVANLGDATGGNNLIYVRPDPRWVTLVQFMQGKVTGAAADVNVRFSITGVGNILVGHNAVLANVDLAPTSIENMGMWVPPMWLIETPGGGLANLDRPFLSLVGANVDGDTNTLTAFMFVFDRRVRELTPTSVILASLPRAPTFVG